MDPRQSLLTQEDFVKVEKKTYKKYVVTALLLGSVAAFAYYGKQNTHATKLQEEAAVEADAAVEVAVDVAAPVAVAPVAQVDAFGNPIQQYDAFGQPIPQLDAFGNPLPVYPFGMSPAVDPFTGAPMTDIHGNPILTSPTDPNGIVAITDPFGNPALDAFGQPVYTQYDVQEAMEQQQMQMYYDQQVAGGLMQPLTDAAGQPIPFGWLPVTDQFGNSAVDPLTGQAVYTEADIEDYQAYQFQQQQMAQQAQYAAGGVAGAGATGGVAAPAGQVNYVQNPNGSYSQAPASQATQAVPDGYMPRMTEYGTPEMDLYGRPVLTVATEEYILQSWAQSQQAGAAAGQVVDPMAAPPGHMPRMTEYGTPELDAWGNPVFTIADEQYQMQQWYTEQQANAAAGVPLDPMAAPPGHMPRMTEYGTPELDAWGNPVFTQADSRYAEQQAMLVSQQQMMDKAAAIDAGTYVEQPAPFGMLPRIDENTGMAETDLWGNAVYTQADWEMQQMYQFQQEAELQWAREQNAFNAGLGPAPAPFGMTPRMTEYGFPEVNEFGQPVYTVFDPEQAWEVQQQQAEFEQQQAWQTAQAAQYAQPGAAGVPAADPYAQPAYGQGW